MIGSILLYLLWIPRFGWAEAGWHAVFQAVSAFCNAGFSTFSDSLMGFADRPLTLAVIMALIVLGGLGFLTLEELNLRETHRVSIIAIHDVLTDQMNPVPDPGTPLKDSDTLIVAGSDEDLLEVAQIE